MRCRGAHIIGVAMSHEREPFMQLAQTAGARRGTRYHAAEAQFVEHDEDSSTDRILIDPLDDRDSRGVLRIHRR